MWNMPYHAEHHAYPAVPWHALPELHKLIEKDLIHTVPGYTDIHLRIIGQLAKGKPFLDYPEHKEGTSKDV
jgi:fatty acid desaturase